MGFDVNEDGKEIRQNLKDDLEKNNKIPVSRLFGYNIDFCIPSYQRGYRWRENNVKKLLEDITVFFENEKDENKHYSLNPIILSDRGGMGNYMLLMDNKG